MPKAPKTPASGAPDDSYTKPDKPVTTPKVPVAPGGMVGSGNTTPDAPSIQPDTKPVAKPGKKPPMKDAGMGADYLKPTGKPGKPKPGATKKPGK